MAKQKKVVRTRRRERKNVVNGQAHVQSTFNNTIISISDLDGNVIAWGSAGAQGFKGSRKSTPFAAQQTAETTAKKALEHGMRSIEVFVRGPGAGREAAIRSLQATGLEVSAIQDVTPIPHTPKCAIERRAFAPGMHGQARKRKTSDYGLQLRAKQKARRIYGLLEKQFRNYFNEASNEPGVTGINLLRHLELRLDNVVYRLGLGASRKQARQLVTHRHFEVNGKLVNVPSYQVKPGDELKVKGSDGVFDVVLDASKVRPVPSWLSFNTDQKSGKILARPERHEMESGVEEQLIAELYSR